MEKSQGLFENDMSIKKKIILSVIISLFLISLISVITNGSVLVTISSLIVVSIVLILFIIKVVKPLEGYGTRELKSILDDVNQNISDTVTTVMQDGEVIKEAKEVCKQASFGIFDTKITSTAKGDELNNLKDLVNELISSTGYNINRISKILDAYEHNNYSLRLNAKGNTVGAMKEVFNKVDNLGDSLTATAKSNLQNGKELESDSSVLENTVSNIQKLLAQQSNELEHSVEELAQITDAIRQTTSDSISMASYAKDVTTSVELGQELATKTANEMDEIVLQITSINEAITVIDQIAFQTNILSLNAAVEAATAGEAGKGFAVVAQEVRNLAGRSAEAAKEIKDLVESATQKANEGKEISDNMINGYGELNQHISSTIELIENVTQASKNQQTSIEQINTNINMVKEHTVKSTQMAQEASQIANKTSKLAVEIVQEANDKKFS